MENNSAYLKNYNSHHIFILLIEKCREYLDKKFVICEVFTKLSKTFDCVLQDLLVAKLEAYGLGEKELFFIYLCLTTQNECVCINDKKSDFQKKISVVRQDSTIEPVLFDFSINDLFFFV